MDSLFASNRGMIIRRILIILAVAAVLMMFVNNSRDSGGSDSSGSTAAASATPDIDYARVYPTAVGSASPTASPTASPSVDTKSMIVNNVKDLSNKFVTQWTTYDYQNPPAYESMPGVAKDPANNADLQKKYQDLVSSMKSKKELSSGTVSSTSIIGLDYSGSYENGSGSGTVRVVVNVSISNSDVGSGGTNIVKTYDVKVKKLDTSSTKDLDKWFIYDINSA